MFNRFVRFRFVQVVPLGRYHRYSVMLPTIETIGNESTFIHVEVCSISFN